MTIHVDEQAAFQAFEFRVGQKVKTKHSGYASGFVIERALVNTENGGIYRSYKVRHGADTHTFYREFEIEQCP